MATKNVFLWRKIFQSGKNLLHQTPMSFEGSSKIVFYDKAYQEKTICQK
jgi:hypothetical protein